MNEVVIPAKFKTMLCVECIIENDRNLKEQFKDGIEMTRNIFP